MTKAHKGSLHITEGLQSGLHNSQLLDGLK